MKKIEHYTRLVNEALAAESFNGNPEELYRPMSYILSLGGKRLRPVLALAACDLFGGDLQKALKPALGIEVFHNFTLLHDDIMDQASLRRGQPTVHKKWNTNIAILSGDAMLVKAYRYIAHADPELLPQVLDTFSQTALEVCEGQQYDMGFESRESVSEEEYLEMIRLKTSVLLGAALKIGAIIAGASEEDQKNTYRFGVNIGIAFQIQDDLLDVFGDPGSVGKQAGGDIINNKKTLLSIHARSKADAEQLSLFSASYYAPHEKVITLSRLMKELGSDAHCRHKMESFYDAALAHLNSVSGNPEVKEELAKFAEWLIRREK